MAFPNEPILVNDFALAQVLVFLSIDNLNPLMKAESNSSVEFLTKIANKRVRFAHI